MNIFSVLDDDEDEKVMPPTPPPAPKKAPTVAPVQNKAAEQKAKPNANGSAPNTKKPSAPVPTDDDVEVTKPTNRGEGRSDHHHGRPGDKGRGRGRQGDRDDKPPRKREFERHSGTGRGREVSKGGSGGHNWGNEKSEAYIAEKTAIGEEGVVEDTIKADVEAELAADGEVSGEAKPEEPLAPVPEPEPVVYTLDEYLAKKADARANAELFGEVHERTVSQDDFAGLQPKTEEDDTLIALSSSGKNKAAKKVEQRSTVAKASTVIDLGFKHAAPQSDREEGRGGRGRGRGGRGPDGRGDRGPDGRGGRGADGRGGRREGRGGDRPKEPRRAAPGGRIDINDANAFPSL